MRFSTCRLWKLVFTTVVLPQVWSFMSSFPLLVEATQDDTTGADFSMSTASRRMSQEEGTLCTIPVEFDPYKHKEVYTVGILAIRGVEAVYNDFNATFNEFLSMTAGQRFTRPIRFQVKPLDFLTLFSDTEQGLVDFIYVNPSAYSCIESEYGAESIVSQVSHRKVGGETYDLNRFGGVIVTLADRDDIQGIQDLKGKVIAAASISGLGSGQMQFKQMIDNGMNYLLDPKQLVFTSNQAKVVNGVLNGDFDVGFVRTDQLERTKDSEGNLVNITKFRIVNPQPNLAIDGVPFPFDSSTELYAEWNVASLTHTSPDVSREVQRALLSLTDLANVGSSLQECVDNHPNGTNYCNTAPLPQVHNGPVQCDTTREIATKALEATTFGKLAGFTTSLSYMQLRSMQEATGFISQEPGTNIWRCVRAAELYDAIQCPEGTNKKSKERFESGCTDIGLLCEEGFQCVCRPCDVPDDEICVGSISIGDSCVSLPLFLTLAIVPVLLFVAIGVHLYLELKRKQSDSVWIVKPEDLEFGFPPDVVGRGAFGYVLLAEYRGTQVAVKRVTPPQEMEGINVVSMFDGTIECTGSGDDDVESGGSSSARKERGFDNHHGGADPSKPSTTMSKGRPAGVQRRNEFISEIRRLARLRHPNITTIMGAVLPSRSGEPMLVMEYMSYGSLYDVLRDDDVVLKFEQKLAILQDVAQGLRFLHSATPCVIHGHLTSRNVLIDSNFCAKVADFGLTTRKRCGSAGDAYSTAPELLTGHSTVSTAADVFGYGTIIFEVFVGKSERDKISFVDYAENKPTIETLPVPNSCPVRVGKLMRDCFSLDPTERPTAEQLDLSLKVESKVKERTSRLESLNKDLAEANRKIASASALQLQHFACMSHEIRTPLNCIIGLSSLMEDTELNAMQKESMDMVVSSGKLLMQIVDDVLDYSKLATGNAEVLMKKGSLQDTLSSVVHMIKTSRLAVDNGITVSTEYDPYLPEMITTDNRRIQQILYNLLGNATKFSKKGGTVEFSVSLVPNKNISSYEELMLVFVVKDYGKGIESSDFGKIFEPFRQTETGMTNTTGGTGLGLAITKKLVEALGGTISVDSAVGMWTEMMVTFPYIDERVDRSSLSSRLAGTTVAVVTEMDSGETRRTLAMLRECGIQCMRFSSVQELLETSILSEKCVCLVHEDLLDDESYEQVTRRRTPCLTTFGPNYKPNGTERHFRSLADTFPSVLINTFGEIVDQQQHSGRASSPMKQERRSSMSSTMGFSQLRVLIAEDNLVNQKVLSRILARIGVKTIRIASNGEEAVAMEAEEEFDLVLMDMQMPKMDGIEACNGIKNRHPAGKGHPPAKVFFITAHVSESFRQTCLDNGAVGYLPKPCTLKGVKQVLRDVINDWF